MSNRFSCNFSGEGDFNQEWNMSGNFFVYGAVNVHAYYFFYCAQPKVTSASIQNVQTNLRECYVRRLKIDYCMVGAGEAQPGYMMVFVLNVPDNYNPSKVLDLFRFSDLPNHTIPDSVLYYDLVRLNPKPDTHSSDIKIDIKKPFKVSPSYKLVFLCYVYGYEGYANRRYKEGTAQVFFDVN